MIALEALNQASTAEFVQQLGWVFEHSPWVAERAAAHRPFPSRDALHAAMASELLHATREEQLAVLRAHPDLGARARMSDASIGEQQGVGLDRLTPEEFDRLHSLNTQYRASFGFPFLYAVKGSTKYAILEALAQRIHATPDDEFAEALRQVVRIAAFRINDIVSAEEGVTSH